MATLEPTGIAIFEKKLREGFINPILEIEKKLQSLRDGLRVYEQQRDDLQKKLNELVRRSLDSTALPNDDLSRAKTELDSTTLIVEDIQSKAIPEAEQNLKTANAELAHGLQGLLLPLRVEFELNCSQKLHEAGSIIAQWMKLLDELFPRLGVRPEWWVKESLYKLTLSPDKSLSDYLKVWSYELK
jgi:hypothetical protein